MAQLFAYSRDCRYVKGERGIVCSMLRLLIFAGDVRQATILLATVPVTYGGCWTIGICTSCCTPCARMRSLVAIMAWLA